MLFFPFYAYVQWTLVNPTAQSPLLVLSLSPKPSKTPSHLYISSVGVAHCVHSELLMGAQTVFNQLHHKRKRHPLPSSYQLPIVPQGRVYPQELPLFPHWDIEVPRLLQVFFRQWYLQVGPWMQWHVSRRQAFAAELLIPCLSHSHLCSVPRALERVK